MEEKREIPEGEELEQALARAYRVYQGNVRRTDEAVYRITRGAREGMSERELLEIAVDAMERCAFGEDEPGKDGTDGAGTAV